MEQLSIVACDKPVSDRDIVIALLSELSADVMRFNTGEKQVAGLTFHKSGVVLSISLPAVNGPLCSIGVFCSEYGINRHVFRTSVYRGEYEWCAYHMAYDSDIDSVEHAISEARRCLQQSYYAQFMRIEEAA